MASQKNLTAKIVFIPGSPPLAAGQVGVRAVSRLPGSPLGAWILDLFLGLDQFADSGAVSCVGPTPGIAQLDSIEEDDVRKMIVRTWDLTGALQDYPWILTVWRNTLLTEPQPL